MVGKMEIEKETKIRELENLIKGMREDGEIFGLVSEDIERINKWANEIKKLNLEKNK